MQELGLINYWHFLRYVTILSQSCGQEKWFQLKNKKRKSKSKLNKDNHKNLLTTGWIFCVCNSGKKVGLGLGNLPAQDVQPVKTCVTTLVGLIVALLANFIYFLQQSFLLSRLEKFRVAADLPKSVNNWCRCVHSVKLVNL